MNFYVDIAHYGVEDIIIRTLGKDKKKYGALRYGRNIMHAKAVTTRHGKRYDAIKSLRKQSNKSKENWM